MRVTKNCNGRIFIYEAAHPYTRDVALLVAAGLDSGAAARCIARAVAADVAPLEQAIADGLITEEAGYHALADLMGLPFAGAGLAVAPEAAWPQAAVNGLAPLAANSRGWRFAFAPRGRILRQVLRHDLRRSRGGLAMTTPSRLDRAAARACAPKIAFAASHGLSERSPLDSARQAPGATAMACLVIASIGVPTLFAWNAALVAAILSLAIGSLFLLIVALRLAATVAQWPSANEFPPLSDRELPVYTVLVPLYRETAVARRLARALCALDYPPAKLDIKILLEEDDEETRRALETCRLPPWITLVVAPDGAPRTKPRALNIGLATARGDLVAVYDAEDRPDPRQLKLAAAAFARGDSRLACLQARLAIENADDSWLTRLFALEYAALFSLVLPSLASLHLPIALGGTSNHFRAEALRRVGGWDAWNVTEDADLGLRLFRRGYRIGALDSITWEEAPHQFSQWMSQRARWLKGWIQTSFVHLAAPRRPFRELGLFRCATAVALSLGAVLTSLFGPFLFGFAMLQAAVGPLDEALGPFGLFAWTHAIVLLVGGFASMIATPLAAAQREGLTRLAPWLFLLPAYYLLVTAAAWRATGELIKNPHHWNKTAHGVSPSLKRSDATLSDDLRKPDRDTPPDDNPPV